VSYSLDIDPRAQATIAALPADALPVLAEVLTVLELTPWNGRPVNPDNPDGAVRNMAFGAGMITYLVLEEERRVDVLLIAWAG
jgi:hypothetical protein